jgi:hypothetical protein
LARSTLVALAIGGFTAVPEDVPGVEEGVLAGDVIPGCPSPGVRLVEQPNAAREQTSAATAMPRKPPFSFCVCLGI